MAAVGARDTAGVENIAREFKFGLFDVDARQAEINLRFLAVKFQGGFEFGDGQVVLAQLGIKDAKVGVGVGRILGTGNGALGIGQSAKRLAHLRVSESQIHVGLRIKGADFDGFLVGLDGVGEFLEILVHQAELVMGIEIEGLHLGDMVKIGGRLGVIAGAFEHVAAGHVSQTHIGILLNGFGKIGKGNIQMALVGVGKLTLKIIVRAAPRRWKRRSRRAEAGKG